MTGLQRMRKAVSGLLLVGILMMMTTVAATAASSTQVVRWNGQANVTGVAVLAPGLPHISPPVFEYGRNDKIKEVTITTDLEEVSAGPLKARCGRGEAAKEICEALNGSTIVSMHDSTAILRRPREIENPVHSGLHPVLKGSLTAQLNAQFTSDDGAGNILRGVAPEIKARGVGVYACANVATLAVYGYGPQSTLPIGDCEDLAPQDGVPDGFDGATVFPVMIPLSLKVVDTGKITFIAGGPGPGDSTGVFENVTGGSARAIVTVKANVTPTGMEVSGKMRVVNAKLILGED